MEHRLGEPALGVPLVDGVVWRRPSSNRLAGGAPPSSRVLPAGAVQPGDNLQPDQQRADGQVGERLHCLLWVVGKCNR